MNPLRIPLVCLVVGSLVLSLGWSGSAPCDDPKAQTRLAGALEDGKPVTEFTLRNSNGAQLRVLDFGATIIELSMPDKHGQFANVILGSDDVNDYVKGFPAASVIGRYANRIQGATFPLDGREIAITKNSGRNHIHGGRNNFSKVLWQGVASVTDRTAQVILAYTSADGEEGFPGRLQVSVTYSLRNDDTLAIDYIASTDKTTVVNLTNHAYFNLAAKGDALNHFLQIPAERYTEVDSALIPTGIVSSVAGTPLDFRTSKRIGERIQELYQSSRGYDHNYVLDGPSGKLQLAAKVIEPDSGRTMECWTTEPGVQLYTANGFNNNPFPRHGAFCLETQHYPDSPNRPEFPSTTLRPGESFRSQTEFRFTR